MKIRPLALLLAGFAAAACGKRGDPLPPQRIVPQPVSELRLLQRGDELLLTFVAPRAATDGSRLPVLDVELQRAAGEGDFEALAQKESVKAAPGEALVRSGPLPPPGTLVRAAARALARNRASTRSAIASLRVLTPPLAPGSLRAAPAPLGVALEWTYPVDPASVPPPAPEPSPSPSPRPGAAAAAPLAPGSPAPAGPPPPGQAAAAPAAVASPASPPAAAPSPASPPAAGPTAPTAPTAPASPPAPPPGPAATDPAPIAGAASPSAASPSPAAASPAAPPGATPSPGVSPSPRPSPSPTPQPPGFLVYRRARTGVYGAALAPKPTLLPGYLDEAVTPGEEWCYVVRFALRTDPLAESASSPEACVEVRDVAPPAAPLGLALLSRPEGVEISWSASPEADLAAYRVYRAEGPDATPVRITELPAGQTEHVDETAVAGKLYIYSLGAVDTAGNESPRSASAQIRR